MHPCGDTGLVAAAGHDELPFLAFDNCCSGVLAHGQHPASCDSSVLQKIEGDESVVLARLGIVEDVAKLLKVAGAKEMSDLAHGFGGQGADG